ncbi:hypothetical protein HPB47_009648 [Ixodes persulcatus]|uniref:Uncharacterized protein n=1 Tax=Ixodes persulcatus TaxID=34615 RepID=A0AC60P1W1_IXOPE|nr:hypothetical protein HPB47_009648 [Ixodes persulcatus]
MDDIGESNRCLVEGEEVVNYDHVVEYSVAPEPTADSVRIVALFVKVCDGPLAAVVYAFPATAKRDIEAFMKDVFGWVMRSDDTSAVVAGDLIVDIARQEEKRFASFMLDRFGIASVNKPTVPTTRRRTCIDLVFTKNVPAVSVHPMAVYHSDHKAMVTVVTK